MHSGRLPWELQRQTSFCRRSPVSKAFLGLSDMEQQVREVQSKLLPNCLLCPGRSGYGVRVAPQRPARARQPCVARGQSGVTTPEPSRAHETFTAASQLAVGSDAGICQQPAISSGVRPPLRRAADTQRYLTCPMVYLRCSIHATSSALGTARCEQAAVRLAQTIGDVMLCSARPCKS